MRRRYHFTAIISPILLSDSYERQAYDLLDVSFFPGVVSLRYPHKTRLVSGGGDTATLHSFIGRW